MSVQNFIAGPGPYYRLTGAAPTSEGLALLSGAGGVAAWGATGRTPPSWTFADGIAVYADVGGAPLVATTNVFVNEEVVTILPNNVNLPRVSVNALAFTATGVAGASYLTFAIPGDRRPFQGNDMGITTILQVDDAPLEVGVGLCLGNGDVRLFLPDGAETVVVYGFTFSYIGNTAIPP